MLTLRKNISVGVVIYPSLLYYYLAMATLPDAAPPTNHTSETLPQSVLTVFLVLSIVTFLAILGTVAYSFFANYSLPAPNLQELPRYTTNESLVISGTAPAHAVVEVSSSNRSYQTTADAKGFFVLTISPAREEETTFHAVARKNILFKAFVSDWSNEVSTIVDRTPPVVTLSSMPKQTKVSSIVVTGTTEENAIVTAFVNNTAVEKAEISTSASFSLKIPLSPGNNEVHFEFADAAGNTTKTTPTYIAYAKSTFPSRLPDSSGNLAQAAAQNTRRIFITLLSALMIMTYIASSRVVTFLRIAQKHQKRYDETG